MTFSLNRSQLAKELALLQSAAEPKGTIPVLGFIRFAIADGKAQLTASDMALTLAVEMEAAGEYRGCIPMKQLSALVKLLDEDEVKFTQKPNGRIEVKAGTSKHLLVTLPFEDFPEAETAQGATISIEAAQLLSMLNHTAFCAGQEGEGKGYIFECVSLETKEKELTLAATNSRQFGAVACGIDSDAELAALLPTRCIDGLIKLCDGEGVVVITADDNHAQFQHSNRTLTTRLVFGKFPNWRLAMPEALQHEVVIDPVKLALSLKRACVTTRESKMIRHPLNLTFTKSQLSITSSSEDGESADTLPIECASLNGSELEIRVNGEHLLSFIAHTEGKVRCQFSDARLLQLGLDGYLNYRYITMALR